jgi:oligopeptide transport system substrate-binding protein
MAMKSKLLAPLFIALFLIGCSNNPHPPALKEKRADGSPWMVSYRGFPDDPRTLDPQVSYDTIGHSIISLVYECLLQYHPFKVDPYELNPCLVEEMPTRQKNKDGTESYLFHLKKGVYFHDDPCFINTNGKGRELTSEDIAYTFKRLADPKVECPVLATLQEYVIGLKEAYDEAQGKGSFDYSKPLKGIEVINPYEFRIHLSKTYPQILYWLAMPFTAPVPREAVEFYDGKDHYGVGRDLFKFHPVGTGPFRMVKWEKKLRMQMVRHERYIATTFPMDGWAPEDENRFRPLVGKALPFLDELQFTIIRESIPSWLLFRQGYLEAAGVNKDVFDNVLSVAHELTPQYREKGVLLYKNVEPTTGYTVFNMEDGLVGKNKKLRQALSSAFDEDLAIELFSNGIDLNAQQLLPPGVFGFQPDFRNPYKQHDIALAKKLLAEAGYPNGIDPKTQQPLEITVDVVGDSPESRQGIEFFKNQVEQLGIRVKIIENTWARFQDKTDKGNFQIMTGSGWHADYPDPENFFFLFYSKNIPPAGNNSSRYQNSEFDRIFEKMCTMDNTPERLKLVYELNRILSEDCPVLLQNHDVNFSLYHSWAPRVSNNPLLGSAAKYTQIDMAEREKRRKEWNQPPQWPIWTLLCFVSFFIGGSLWWSKKRYA